MKVVQNFCMRLSRQLAEWLANHSLGIANVATQLAARAQATGGGRRGANAPACLDATTRAARIILDTRNNFCMGEDTGRGIVPGALTAGFSRSIDQATGQLKGIEQSCDLN